METKIHVYDGMELPSYLGFGIINEESIRFTNGKLHAEYVLEFDNTMVHSVALTTDYCEFSFYFQGERISLTCSSSLQKALLFNFMKLKLDNNDCFNYLVNKTCELGNIYVNYPKIRNTDVSL